MARSFALVFAVAALAMLGWWLAHAPADATRAKPEVVAAKDGDGDSEIPRPIARKADSQHDQVGGASEATSSPDRVAIERGMGILRLIPVFAGMPIDSMPFTLGLIPEAADVHLGRLDRLSAGIDQRVDDLELPAGSYRVFVVRGPGDAADAERSIYWGVDQFDDLVHVGTKTTTEHEARVVRTADEVPPRGSARIRGIAILDGKPAAGCLVSSDPISGSRSARVAADGSFDLGPVQAGLQRLQLSAAVELVRRNEAVTRIAELDVAPRDGENLQVRIDALSARLELELVDPRGTPVQAEVRIIGIPWCVLPGIGVAGMIQFCETDADGRLQLESLPTCAPRFDISSQSYAAPDQEIRVRAGTSQSIRIQLQDRVTVEGSLDLVAFGLGTERVTATVFFLGPRQASVPTRRDGSFSCDQLIPGRYETRVLTFRMRREAGPTIDVGPGGLSGLRIAPSRSRAR